MSRKKLFSPSVLLPCAVALLTVCTGCFEREVPHPRVVAHSMAEALQNAGAVTTLDLHLDGVEGGADGAFEFPEGLERLPALDFLSVRGRRSLPQIPESICAAGKLETLDLAGTGVKTLPESLGRMPALRRLYLSDNGLAELPEAVCAIAALEYLNLDRNSLTGLPESAGALPALKWMRLNGNRIGDLPAAAGSGWASIRKLYLRGNGLRKVPAAILEMKTLEELDLGENDIAELPPALCLLPNLRRLDIDGNPRLAALPANIGDMKALTHLFAYRCAIPTNEQARVRAALPDPVRRFIAF